MTSLITALMLTMSLNIADAKPHKQKQSAKRAVPHQHYVVKKPRHNQATHRRYQYHVAKPAAPAKAHSGRAVYFYRGHWVMAHHKPHFMWKWNHVRSKWVIVFRF
jgi:hypothetical protein